MRVICIGLLLSLTGTVAAEEPVSTWQFAAMHSWPFMNCVRLNAAMLSPGQDSASDIAVAAISRCVKIKFETNAEIASLIDEHNARKPERPISFLEMQSFFSMRDQTAREMAIQTVIEERANSLYPKNYAPAAQPRDP